MRIRGIARRIDNAFAKFKFEIILSKEHLQTSIDVHDLVFASMYC